MNMHNFKQTKLLCINLLVILAITLSCSAQNEPSDLIIQQGIYDGNIGSERVIFFVQNSETDSVRGTFIFSRGKAIEKPEPYSMIKVKNSLQFRSEQYVGELKLKDNTKNFEGTLLLSNQKRRFLFFRVRVEVKLVLREPEKVNPSMRYQQKTFEEFDVQRNILYGQANGYWINLPQQNQPYIEMIAKGMVKTFKENETLDLKMDVYQPQGDTLQKRPLVLFIHGGAFYMGSKQCDTAQELAKTFVQRGYVVVCIDYRLGFKFSGAEVQRSGYRACQDAHAALRFLSHHAKEYRIDPDQIYVSGTSAGAIASLNLAFMTNDERPKDTKGTRKHEDLGNLESSGNNLTDKFTIKSVANMWGAITDLKIIDPEEKKSVISIHGTADDIVPYGHDYPFQKTFIINKLIMDKMYGSKSIHEWLDKLNFKNKLISLEGQKHEPHHDEFSHFNQYMDTIKINVSRFFYEETAPTLTVPQKQLTIDSKAAIKPIYYEIENGNLELLQVEGGVKTTPDRNCSSIIWFSNEQTHTFTLYTTNRYDAWNVKKYEVTISN